MHLHCIMIRHFGPWINGFEVTMSKLWKKKMLSDGCRLKAVKGVIKIIAIMAFKP